MLFEIKREVCHFSLSSEIIPSSRLVADDSDCVIIHADDQYDPTHESQIAISNPYLYHISTYKPISCVFKIQLNLLLPIKIKNYLPVNTQHLPKLNLHNNLPFPSVLFLTVCFVLAILACQNVHKIRKNAKFMLLLCRQFWQESVTTHQVSKCWKHQQALLALALAQTTQVVMM